MNTPRKATCSCSPAAWMKRCGTRCWHCGRATSTPATRKKDEQGDGRLRSGGASPLPRCAPVAQQCAHSPAEQAEHDENQGRERHQVAHGVGDHVVLVRAVKAIE